MLLSNVRKVRNELRYITPYIRRPFVSLCMTPTFLIIGAQKAGTTSLLNYLTQHRSIMFPSLRKELHFFDLYFDRGAKWYQSCFPLRREGKMSVDKSPYYIFHPLAPQRAHSFDPNLKLIALLRDPVKRAYSHFHHEIENGRENRSFRQAVEEELERVETDHIRLARSEISYSAPHQRFSYYARGRYVDQIDLWMQYFRRDQLYIETAERFFREPQAICGEIFDFLNVEQILPSTTTHHNPGNYQPISKTDRVWLNGMYQESNQKIESDYGVNIGDWG